MYSLIKAFALHVGLSILLLSPTSAIAHPLVDEYYPQ